MVKTIHESLPPPATYASATKAKPDVLLRKDIVREVKKVVTKSLKDGSDNAQKAEYDPNKTVIITQINDNRFSKSTVIKREISKVFTDVKIDRAYGTAKDKFFV